MTEISPYDLAFDYAVNTNSSIFLTGKAGTGKTTFLHRLQEKCDKQIMVVAPTGVAAINAHGVTIHSLFQLPPQIFLPTPNARRKLIAEIQMQSNKRKLLRSLEMLVIDEISMVRSDLLDAIDCVLRHVRRRPQLPFGGVQMLFIGDLYQLSPVARENDWQLLREYYQGPYFFQALVFREIRPIYIELNHVFRQADATFINLLNQVRTNQLTTEGTALLNSRYLPQWQQTKDQPFHIILATHNAKVDAINADNIRAINKTTYTYEANIEGTFPESLYPMATTLQLKKGARVMFIKNDSSPEKEYYNGLLGIVEQLDDEQIIVACQDSDGDTQYISVHPETWENIRYTAQEDTETINSEVIGQFTHYPLRLAWAVTIHKAQGLTFDHVVIDAADAFASGQVYVALSRCRTLEGIILLSPIPARAFTNAPDVAFFTAHQPSIAQVAQGLTQASQLYLMQQLMGLYDFRDTLIILQQLSQLISEDRSFNSSTALPYVHNLFELLSQDEATAEKFRQQIQHIFLHQPMSMDHLTQRLKAAEQYFSTHIDAIIEQLKTSPVFTDDKSDAKRYEELMTELYSQLSVKRFLQRQVAQQPSIQHLHKSRQSFVLPKARFSARGADVEASLSTSKNPLLFDQLKRLRYEVAQENDWENQLYIVANTQVLVDISNQLPRTKKDLLAIKQFGPKRYALWGDRILHLVKRYTPK